MVRQLMIPFYTFFRKELRILSSFCYNKEDFHEVMKMMAEGEILDFQILLRLFGSTDLKKGTLQGYDKMITSRISLDDVVAKGFEELVARKDDHVKILISPKLASHKA